MKKNAVNIIVFVVTILLIIGTVAIIALNVPKYAHTDDIILKVTKLLKINLDEIDTQIVEEKLVNYPVIFDKKKTIEIKVLEGEDPHYVEIDGYTLVLNSNYPKFNKAKKGIVKNQDDITDIVVKVIKNYKESDITRTKVCNDIVREIHDYLGTDIVVRVSLTDYKHK